MDLNQIISPVQRYAFLAGAGVSFDEPSNLPVARQIVFEMLNILNIEAGCRSEFKSRFDTGELRFEQFIEQIVRCYDDNELGFFKPLSSCHSPNHNHYFLAQALGAEHIVFTTNFDALIEQAGQHLGHSIKSVYNDASVIASKSQTGIPLYKLHGTLMDESGNDQRSSVVALISSMGKLGEGLSFAPQFRQVINESLQSCPLIVLGYSGSDDFDILPALAQVDHPRQLVWIDHSPQRTGFQVHDASDWSQVPDRLAGVLNDLLLMDHWRKEDVFVVTGNTSQVLDEIAKILHFPAKTYMPGVSHQIPSYFYEDWKFEHALEEWRDRFFIANIYESLGEYTKAIPFLEDALRQVETLSETAPEVHLHIELAGLYLRLRDMTPGKYHIDRATQILQDMQLLDLYAYQLNEYNAIYYAETGDYQKAVNLLESTLPDQSSSYLPGYLYEHSRIAAQQGDRWKARQLAEEALVLHRQNGKLNSVIHCLILLTNLYREADEYRLALDAALETLRTCALTHNFSLMADGYEGRYRIYRALGLAGKAFADLTEELALHQKHTKDVYKEAVCLAKMASLLERVEEIRGKFLPNMKCEIKAYYVEGLGCNYVPSDMPSAMFSIFSGLTDNELVYISERSEDSGMDFPGVVSRSMNPFVIKDTSHSLVIEDTLPNTTYISDEYASRAIQVAEESNIEGLREEVMRIIPSEIIGRLFR